LIIVLSKSKTKKAALIIFRALKQVQSIHGKCCKQNLWRGSECKKVLNLSHHKKLPMIGRTIGEALKQ
jgi:hypothetical protein